MTELFEHTKRTEKKATQPTNFLIYNFQYYILHVVVVVVVALLLIFFSVRGFIYLDFICARGNYAIATIWLQIFALL